MLLLLLLVTQSLLTAVLWSSTICTHILVASAIGMVLYWATVLYIPSAGELLMAKGFWGVDLNKHPKEQIDSIRSGSSDPEIIKATKMKRIPECLGVVTAFAYFIGVLLFYGYLRIAMDWGERKVLRIDDYMCGALTIIFTTFLGFVDDVLDLRWRYKIWLPYVAAIPLIVTYTGPTHVRVPRILLPSWLADTASADYYEIELGLVYYLYMINLSAFCSNAINIYAGVNGLEAGQSLIWNLFIIIHNAIECYRGDHQHRGDEHSGGGGGGMDDYSSAHAVSLIYAIIFMYVTAGLLRHNRYPSRVFVGDTFTMLAGVHMAACAIMGHFAKTLLLFSIPQILNFALSLPQLLKIVPCPRHRIPTYNPTTKKLTSSKNWTLINLVLEVFGDMTEKRLVSILLALQVVSGIVGLAIRYSPVYNVIFQ